MNKKLVLLGAGLLLTAATASAQKLVTGKVTDSHGEPVMGATVRVAGTKILTTTDANGNFKLNNVPASAKKLNVSFIGMQPSTVSVAGNVSVVLKDNELGEAVVIGYGTARKVGTVVGSVSKVGGEIIADKPAANLADALQGKLSGVQIFSQSGDAGSISASSIRMRGVGSLSASNTPLLVIDGSPAEMSMLSLLNDKDIESVTTLKDASATSIYGSRAANGVIYVTTKRGRSDEKAVISVSQKIGWSQLANGIGNPMNANELLQFQLENGIITSSQYATYKAHGANTDWADYYFDNAAPMYNTDFSIRGGSGSTNYFVSASYLKKNSLTRVSHFDRYTLRTNLETKPKSWLTMGIKQNIAYTDRLADEYTNRDGGGTGSNAVTAAFMLPTYWDPYDPESAKNHQFLFGPSSLYDSQWIQTQRPRKCNDVVYNGVAYLQINPVKGLTLKSQLGLYADDTRARQSVYLTIPGATTGMAKESHARSSVWTITNTAEYKFKVAENHEITLLAGQEGIKGTSNNFSAVGAGITDDRLSNLGSVTDYRKPGYGYSKYEYLSFFGRVDYGFKDKYFANFTLRNDQSSRFGADNRGANFLSGGLMWRVTAEDFMVATRGWLTDLQLKASLGTTGNSELGSDYLSLGLVGTTQFNGNSGWLLAQPSNEKLGWEKQLQFNFGVTARLFDRLGVDFNVYKRKTSDMLMSTPLPTTTGFSSQMMNVGDMSNRGVELELNYDVIRTQDAYVNVYANYSYTKNKIESLFYGLKEWPVMSALLNYTVGKSLEYYMPIYAGVDKEDGAPMWYKVGHKGNPVHEYNPETMTKTYSDDLYQATGKSRFAPHSGGFGFSANWKGFTLSADFAYVLGKYMVNNEYLFSCSRGNAMNGFNQDKDMLNIWKKPGDLASLPGFDYETEFDTHLLENASFMRMKNLSLSYDLPKGWMEATNFFTNVRFNFVARNLFTVTKYKGSDPEIDLNIALGSFPATRDFTLGVEVTF